VRDLKTEAYLTEGGYKFSFETQIDINRIDLVEAKENPARMNRALDFERVNAYGVSMLEHTSTAHFPAIVVFADKPKLHLVTGLHRLTAAKDASCTRIDAYIVSEPDEYRRDLLTRSINTIEGLAPSQKENLNSAFAFLREHTGAKLKDVAVAFGLKEDAIKLYQWQIAAEERAVRLGVGTQLCSMAASSRILLGRIQSDISFARTVEAASQIRGKASAIETLVKDVRAARTEEAAAGVLQRFTDELKAETERAKARFGRSPSSLSTRFLGRVKSVIREQDLQKLALSGIPADRMGESISLVEQGIEFLGRILKYLTNRRTEMERRGWSMTRAESHGSQQSGVGLSARSDRE
jgi:hypothetical protein